MIIDGFASYGVLRHEKETVYSVGIPAGEVYDKVQIDIPGNVVKNEYGVLCYDTGNGVIPLNDMLRSAEDHPILKWYDGKWHTVSCKLYHVE